MVDISSTKKINYLEFLHCFQPDDRVTGLTGDDKKEKGPRPSDELREALMEQITTVLYANKQALLRTFQFFDSEQNHIISKAEFIRVLKCLNNCLNVKNPPLTNEQIELLAEHCIYQDGAIDYMAFLQSLVICDMHTGEMFA